MAPLDERLAAVATACQSGTTPTLRIALVDPLPAVRRLAVSCWPATAELAPIESLALDSSVAVRVALARRLGELDGPEATALLDLLALDDVGDVRAAALASGAFPGGPTRTEWARTWLGDPAAVVRREVAARLHRHPEAALWSELTDDERAVFDQAYAEFRMAREAPEQAALAERVGVEVERAASRYRAADDDCGRAAAARLDALREDAEAVWHTDDGGIEAAENVRADLGRTEAAHAICLTGEPLETAESSGFGGIEWVATPRVGTTWFGDFGLMRADSAGLNDGGELRASAGANLFAYTPNTWEGEAYPSARPSYVVGGAARYETFYRVDELTGVYGGGLGAANWPFLCLGMECHAGVRAFGRHESGDDASDFPARLVAASDRWGGAGHWVGQARANRYGLGVGFERTRYLPEALRPAGMDQLVAHFRADTRFQLRADLVRTWFATDGAAANAPTRDGFANRDQTIITALSGVRFGADDDSDTILRFEVLAGAALPIFDNDAFDLDPEVVFDLALEMGNAPGDGGSVGFTIAGSRRLEASPRNFAVQSVVDAIIRFDLRFIQGSAVDLRAGSGAYYTLVEHGGPLTDDERLRINSVGGTLSLEMVFLDWFGIAIEERIEAAGDAGSSLGVGNVFTLEAFVPLGRFGLDPEVPWP